MFTELNHVGVVVESLEEAKRFFGGTLGLAVDRERTPTDEGYYMAPERLRTYHLRPGQGSATVEVLVPQDETSGTARLLKKRGPGLHHICFTSDNLAEDSKHLRSLGLQQIDLSHGEGDLQAGLRTAFFHPKSCLGILIEVVEKR